MMASAITSAAMPSTMGTARGTTQGSSRCGLVLADGGRGLEADLEEDGHAVADTALNTARVVRLGLELGAGDACLLRGGVEGGGWHEGLEGLDGGDGHHGVGEGGLQLVEAGLAETRGRIADDAGDGSASAVVGVSQLSDACLHGSTVGVVGASHGEVVVDLLTGDSLSETEEGRVSAHGVTVAKELDVSDRGDKGNDLDAIGLLEPLLSDSTGGHASNCLTGGAAATAR
ncbi:hypothetical protein HG531_012536 [Fusarium graminearum]|nr:hypothetical protein HG531_012536 [Fusarium graminearum]